MRIFHLKVAVWALVIFELWLLLQVPAVGEALFDFIIGGEVPGTDKVLSPTGMIYFLMGVFVLAAGLIFKKEIVGLINRGMVRRTGQQAEYITAPKATRTQAVSTTPQQQSARVIKTARFIQKQRAMALLLLARARTSDRFAAIEQYMQQKLRPRAAAALTIIRQGLQRLRKQAQKAGVWLVAMAAYVAYLLWVFVSTRSMQLWRWVRPYMERCDRWLNYKLHQNDVTAALLDFGSELGATIRKLVVRLRSFR